MDTANVGAAPRPDADPGGGWLTLVDTAERLGVAVTRVRQWLREGRLLAERDEAGVLRVPAAFLLDGEILPGLPGTITVLRDAGFADSEALRWLFTPDDTLPGTPVEALRARRVHEVNRRAQALAL